MIALFKTSCPYRFDLYRIGASITGVEETQLHR